MYILKDKNVYKLSVTDLKSTASPSKKFKAQKTSDSKEQDVHTMPAIRLAQTQEQARRETVDDAKVDKIAIKDDQLPLAADSRRQLASEDGHLATLTAQNDDFGV